MMMPAASSCFLLPLLISGLLTALLLKYAPCLRLMDHPGHRKVHSRPVPRGGGLAIYAALLATFALVPEARSERLFIVLGLGGFVVLLGLLDDLVSLSWQWRLAVQGLSALAAVYTGQQERGWLEAGLAVIWVVGLTNAFNMLDNMDALSAGVAWIAAAMFALAVPLAGSAGWEWQQAAPYLVLMGSLSGFLWFNRPPARIFMGDAGSTFLGFFLGVWSFEGSRLDLAAASRWAVPLCILAVPWYDLTTVVALRLWQGRSPFHGDKQHLSHRLVKLGLSSPAAVGVIYLLGLASGLAGLLLYQASAQGTLLVGLLLACWWLAIAVIEYFRHYRSPSALAGDVEEKQVLVDK